MALQLIDLRRIIWWHDPCHYFHMEVTRGKQLQNSYGWEGINQAKFINVWQVINWDLEIINQFFQAPPTWGIFNISHVILAIRCSLCGLCRIQRIAPENKLTHSLQSTSCQKEFFFCFCFYNLKISNCQKLKSKMIWGPTLLIRLISYFPDSQSNF